MSNYQLKAGYNGKTGKHSVMLSLISFEEDDAFIIYSPALDLSGYGRTEAAAKKSFEITLEEFLKYTDNKNTIWVELEKHGWHIRGSKKKPKIEAPTFSQMLETNDDLKAIVDNKPFKQILQEVEI